MDDESLRVLTETICLIGFPLGLHSAMEDYFHQVLSMSMLLPWGARVSSDFVAALIAVCIGLGWGPQYAGWLMGCMAFESAGTFRADIRNAAGSGAVGLIQFMPSTACGLGTTIENLSLLAPQEQLTYVGHYFRPYASRIKSLNDMYMAILLPAFIGAPDDAVLFSGGVSYRQNAGLDANSDGRITKAEACARVAAMLAKGLQTGNAASCAWPSAA